MGICYINLTIEIPNVNAQTMTPEIAGDAARTAGNILRFDASSNAVKRSWVLKANYLTATQFSAIYNYLKSINFGFTYFWIDELGGAAATDSIMAKVTLTSSERVQFQAPTVWESQGKNISLTVIEQ